MSQYSDPVSVVPVLDTSNSMTYSGYVANTVICTNAFLSCCQPGDKMGVASYDTSGRVTYAFTTIDQNLTQITQAVQAVQQLSFTGSCTNIGGGILTARSMLDTAPYNRGMVLLSDGYQNCGTNPTTVLPSGYPIYSCAMGPASDQNLMQQIATGTGGTYYYAPYAFDMVNIYNQIRAQNVPQAQLLYNQTKTVASYGFLFLPVTISSGNSLGQFSVVWNNSGVVYTSSSIPAANQISITLVNPSGQTTGLTPAFIGSGYVTFNVPNPQVGQWYVQIENGNSSVSISLGGGAFEFSTGQQQAVQMKVSAPETVTAGEPIPVSVTLTDNGQHIEQQTVYAQICQPHISVANALKQYADELGEVQLANSDDVPAERVATEKLKQLHQSKLAEMDILPHRRSVVALREVETAQQHATIIPTDQAGSYTIQVNVEGYSNVSGTPFQRSQLVTVLVKEAEEMQQQSTV